MNVVGADFLLVCDEAFSIVEKGGILYDKDSILEVGDYECLAKKAKGEKKYYKDCVLTPALANLHLHLEFSQNQGILKYGSFEVWLNSVIENRDILMGENLQSAMQKEIQRLLKSGVGFVGAISSYGYDLEILAQSPLRVLYFNEVIGSKPEMLDILFENFLVRLKASEMLQSSRFYPAVAIHSPYSVHSVLLQKVLTLTTAKNLPLSVHFLESKAEREWLTNAKGYFLEFFKKYFQTSMLPFYTISDFIQAFEGRGAYFVHCLEATKEELESIKKGGGKVISCVRSNRLLNNRLLDLDLCLKLGISPIFATDGKSSNESLSLLDELRIALYAYSYYNLEELAKILWLGVTYYAFKDNILKLQGGSLKQGYLPDFALFELQGVREQIPLQLLLYAKEAKSLYISGKKVF